MSSWNPDIDVIISDSEDDDNEELRTYYKGREALLFVIDAGMNEYPERFAEALQLVRSAFISGLLVNDKDLLGVVFANTEHSPEPIEVNCLQNIVVPQNCAVFLPMRQLSKPIVEYFLQFVATAEDNFKRQYGIERGNFASMIRLCCNLFEHCGYNLNNSTIVYLTDCPLPHESHTQEYQRALQKAKDLGGQEVEFHVIPMVNDFNYDVFYKEFLTLVRDDEPDSFIPPDAQQLREILADRKLKQDYLKRTLGNFKFSLGPGLEISAQYFNYFKRRGYPRKVKLMRVDNSVVKQKRVIVVRKQDAETLEFSEEREVISTSGWYEIQVGTAPPIRITTEQMNRVRNLHEPGMILLGFKPKSTLTDYVYYRPSNFMYPNDRLIAGSKSLFRALWQRCLEREKIAICLFMCKRKSMPRYVALVPVTAQDGETHKADHHTLLSGDGFKIVYLPFAKHIRNLDFVDWNSIDNDSPLEGIDLFEKIIKKLRIKYQSNVINDPTIELLQAKLLALALDIKTENDGRTDMPDASAQDERIAKILPDLDKLMGNDVETVKRRAASANAGSSASKIAKITEDDIHRYEFVEQMVANKALSSCTVAQLRIILDEHYGKKAPVSSKKQALIDQIIELSAQ